MLTPLLRREHATQHTILKNALIASPRLLIRLNTGESIYAITVVQLVWPWALATPRSQAGPDSHHRRWCWWLQAGSRVAARFRDCESCVCAWWSAAAAAPRLA